MILFFSRPSVPDPDRLPHLVRRNASGFTLVELLVVIAIIGALVGMLLPAVQSAREASRRAKCQSNMRQLTLALHNYEIANSSFPPSALAVGAGTTGTTAPWSGQSLLLPYLEGGNIYSSINFKKPYSDAANKNLFPPNGVAALRVDVLSCPSDPKANTPVLDTAGQPKHYPLTYGLCVGTYLVYDPATRRDGGTAFSPFAGIPGKRFIDGMSSTLAFAEVKSYTPRSQDIPTATMPSQAPTDPAAVASLVTSGSFSADGGHTEWVCGRTLHIGFTTTFPPQTVVPYGTGPTVLDVDVCSIREGVLAGGVAQATSAAVTSRSHHSRIVNTAFMDGSVRTVSAGIDAAAWQALGTRAGGETVGSLD